MILLIWGAFLNGRHTKEVPSFIVLFWILFMHTGSAAIKN